MKPGEMIQQRCWLRRVFTGLCVAIFLLSGWLIGGKTLPQIFSTGAVSAQRTTYYVAPNGNDSNPGTAAQPWQTIQKAAGTLTAGETVYIRAGTYREQVIPQRSGSAGNYITYAAYLSETVTIDGARISLPNWETGLFVLEEISYIKVSGLRVINAGPHDNNAGIYVDDASHIIIENNTTYNTVSSGVGVWNSDHITIDGNEIELACNDGEQEAITVAITNQFEVKNNHVHHSGPGTNGGEGIDAKDGSRNGKIHGNHVHDIDGERPCLYVDSWDKHTFNIEVYNNIVHHCGAGISLAAENGGLLENVRVYNNIVYQNRTNGLEIGDWGEPGIFLRPVDNVTFINNTVYDNGTSGWGGGFLNENPDVTDITVRNNIFSQNFSAQIINESTASLTVDHNLIDGSQEYTFAISGTDTITGDPRFVAAAGADFHLQADSPAIDRGSPVGGPEVDFDGNARPQDGNGDGTAAYDPGAYEVPVSYYVAPDGDDSQPGSFSQPWRTIQKAANTVQAGDTVQVREGVYNETVTIPTSGSAGRGYITFQNYLKETPTLDGTGLAVPDRDTGMFLIVDQSYLIIKGFEIRNYQSAIVDRVPVGINVQGTGHHIQIRDNHIHHIETTATPAGPDLTGADAHGILVLGTAAPASIHNIIIDGNELDHLKLGSSEALVLNGNVEIFTVTNNIVHDNDNIGIDLIGFEGTSTGPYDQVRDGVVINNTVYNIDSRNNPAYGGERAADGIYVDGGTAITIERNRVYSSNIGIELASEHQAGTTSYVTVRNNFVFNNHAAGISLGGYDAERGGTKHCAIVNNTLYHNDTGQQGNGEIALNFQVRDNVIKNNILVANSQSLLVVSEFSLTNNEVDYNLYFAPAGIENSEWQWAGTSFEGFADYQRQTGNDAHSAFVDPRFVDLLAPDLHLRPTSPALDAGQTLAEAGNYDIDAEARRQGDAIDLGADEASLPD